MHICFEWYQNVYPLDTVLFYNVSLHLMFFTSAVSVFVWLVVTIWRVWRFWRRISVVVKYLYVFKVCYLGQFQKQWLVKNDILFQIFKLWEFIEIFEVVRLKIKNIYWCQTCLNRCHIFIQPLLLKCLYKDLLNINELFWDLKWKIGVLEKYKKTLETKRTRILEYNYGYIYLIGPVHN